MEIIGRLTADATVNTTKDNRKVVNFSIAVNDTYKKKDGEQVKLTEYYRCRYWLTTKVADFLTKGTLVQLGGWLSKSAWKDTTGNPHAEFNFHTEAIKFHGGGKRNDTTPNAPTNGNTKEDKEDGLPF